MEIKILQVFYGKDGLPYKDKDRQVHFPITGTGFLGASNTTKIKFYYDELDNLDETTWVAVSKLPNGRVGSRVLESYLDDELNEHYALLELDNYYTQYKGDVFISLQGYQGGVDIDYDEENSQYEIHGTPTIAATGSIKFTINYANQFVGSGETDNINFQRILAALGTKLGIRTHSEHVEELPSEGSPDIFYVVKDDPNDPNLQNIYIWNENTRHYIWVGDNRLNLGEYYTKEQGEDFEQGIGNRLSNVENELSSLASGSPKGVYDTLEDLESAYPTGADGIYLITGGDDAGHWYYWNEEEWTDGGVYQATGLGNDSVSLDKLKTNITDFINENVSLQTGYINPTTNVIQPSYPGVPSSTVITNILFLKTGVKVSLRNTIFKFYRYGKCSGYSATSVTSFTNVNTTEITIAEDGYYIFQIVLNDGSGNYAYIDDYVSDIKISFFKSIEEIYKYKNDIKKFFGIKNNVIWATLSTTGLIALTHTNINNVVFGIIRNDEFTTLKITAKSGYQFNYALYDHSTNAFVSRGSTWSTSSLTLNNDYDVVILGATLSSVTVDLEDMKNNIVVTIDDNIVYDDLKGMREDIDNFEINEQILISKMQFLSNIQSCEFVGKNIHISIDDVWQSLNALIQETPTSIYDIAFFNSLKNWHDIYGFKFTLNVFNTHSVQGYDISNVPNTWASEFQAAKDWLKFAFHSGYESTNYNTATTFNTDYTKFVAQIYRITGTYECIDTFTRLGYFGGTLEQIKSYTGDYKPIGLLTADDDRLSYYFVQKQNDLVIENGKYYDVDNKLLFVRSALRMDYPNYAAQVIQFIESNIKYNKYIEIFFHEQSYYNAGGADKLNSDMSALNTYATSNGYTNNFLMDLFKL